MVSEQELVDALRAAQTRTKDAKAAMRLAEHEYTLAAEAEREADRALLRHQFTNELRQLNTGD